jgi:hypothetical protein
MPNFFRVVGQTATVEMKGGGAKQQKENRKLA